MCLSVAAGGKAVILPSDAMLREEAVSVRNDPPFRRINDLFMAPGSQPRLTFA